MTKKEKEEVIKKMGLGNKYVNIAINILKDFLSFMVFVCIVLIIIAMFEAGFIGSLLFLRDCIAVYIIATLISKIFRMIIRKVKNHRS